MPDEEILTDTEKRLRWLEHYCHDHEGKIEERWGNQWRQNRDVNDFIVDVRNRLRNIERRMWVAAGGAGVVAAIANTAAAWLLNINE